MHELVNTFEVDPMRTETILIARRPARWRRGFNIEVAGSKGEVLQAEELACRETWRVYMDG